MSIPTAAPIGREQPRLARAPPAWVLRQDITDFLLFVRASAGAPTAPAAHSKERGMSDVINRPHQVAPDRRVKIPRSRVREMLNRLGASMSRRTTKHGAAEFGATSDAAHGGAVSLETSTIPPLGLSFRQAADRVNELLKLANNSAEHDPDEAGAAGQQRAEWMREQIAIRQAIASTPAATIGDVLVKLEMLAHPEVGAGAYEVEADDINHIADDLERIGAGGAIGQPLADDFADAVAAVRAEGAGVLSLPEVPTLAMVEAGAMAAGVTHEAARAIYAAMAAAFQQGRAA